MVVWAAVLCLLIQGAACAVEADSESSTVQANARTPTLSTGYKAQSTYLLTKSEIVSSLFSTKLHTTIPPMAKKVTTIALTTTTMLTTSPPTTITTNNPTTPPSSTITSTRHTTPPSSTITTTSHTTPPSSTITTTSHTIPPSSTITTTIHTTPPSSTITSKSHTTPPSSTITSTRHTTPPSSTITTTSHTTPPSSTITTTSHTTPPSSTITSTRHTTPPASTITTTSHTTPPSSTITFTSHTTPPSSTITSTSHTTPPSSTITSTSHSTPPSSTITNTSHTTPPSSTITSTSHTTPPSSTITSTSHTTPTSSTITNTSHTTPPSSTITSTSHTTPPSSTINTRSHTTPPSSTITSTSHTTPPSSTITTTKHTTPPSSTITTTNHPSNMTIFTTNTPATLIPSSRTLTTTTGTTWKPELAECHNGGIFDGIKCICPGDFYGTFCELASDRIPIESSVEAQVNVEMTIINREFTEDLMDATSEEYKRFESIFISTMNEVYYGIPGYKDLIIQEIRKGSVIVRHKIIAVIKYKPDQIIAHQYNQMLIILESLLKELPKNCTTASDTLCIGENSIKIEPIQPPSEEELCMEKVPDGYEEFYSPVFLPEGLVCVSACDPNSPKYISCNDGTCYVKRTSGPQCLCARTDLYIYTSSHCTGTISKLGLFIGCGTTMGVLLVVSIVLGILIYRVKKSMPKPFLTEDFYITTII